MAEGSYYRKIAQEALANKQEAPQGTPESYRERGQRALDDAEKKREERLERAKERREKAGKGLSERGAATVAGWAAGGIVAGGLWTIGKALEYALWGWELDSNGWPKIDKQSIAHVDRWHNKVAGIKG